MSMTKLANHILERAQIKNQGITNFHLQQILYFTLVDALKESVIDKEWLSKNYTENDKFLLTGYGPLEFNVYVKYKRFGSTPIINVNTKSYPRFLILNDIIDNLIQMDPTSLMEESFLHPISKYIPRITSGKIKNIRYSLNDLIEASQTEIKIDMMTK